MGSGSATLLVGTGSAILVLKRVILPYLIIVFIRVDRSVVSDKISNFLTSWASSLFAARGSEIVN
jgi:hypothetical protein